MSDVRAKAVDKSRRQFVQRVAYTAPLITILSVMPSVASAGSGLTGGAESLTTRQHKNNNNHWW